MNKVKIFGKRKKTVENLKRRRRRPRGPGLGRGLRRTARLAKPVLKKSVNLIVPLAA